MWHGDINHFANAHAFRSFKPLPTEALLSLLSAFFFDGEAREA